MLNQTQESQESLTKARASDQIYQVNVWFREQDSIVIQLKWLMLLTVGGRWNRSESISKSSLKPVHQKARFQEHHGRDHTTL